MKQQAYNDAAFESRPGTQRYREKAHRKPLCVCGHMKSEHQRTHDEFDGAGQCRVKDCECEGYGTPGDYEWML